MTTSLSRGAVGVPRTVGNGLLRVQFRAGDDGTIVGVDRIEVKTAHGWRAAAWGIAGVTFSTSLGDADAATAQINRTGDGGWAIEFSVTTAAFEATESLTIDARAATLRREQTYLFKSAGDIAIHPGLRLSGGAEVRYTYPLNVYEAKLADVPALRSSASWAVPLPAHIWSAPGFVCVYGVDRVHSRGTLDVRPDGAGGVLARAYLPDESNAPPPAGTAPPDHRRPTTMRVEPGQALSIRQFLCAAPLKAGDDPLWESCRLTAAALLDERPQLDWPRIADGIAHFYPGCGLWDPEAFGHSRGFFSNMWVHTTAGTPVKRGDWAGYFDLGWGEGYQVRTVNALARHWRRTGRAELLSHIDETTRNIELFRRTGDRDQPFYDRFHPAGMKSVLGREVPGGFGDFLGYPRVWTHATAAIGLELLDAYESVPNYPSARTRQTWLSTARSIGGFLARHQRDDGDLQDGFADADDGEINRKPHRIPARAITCGLWAMLARIDEDPAMLRRATRLAKCIAPEIECYEFYNQLVDVHGDNRTAQDFTDPEGAIYALDGLTLLYAAMRDPAVLALCRRCAAYALTWTYFYDLPTGYNGVTRGGTCCRMPDFPLLYLGAAAQAVRPLSRLGELTGDPLYRQMAAEMLHCIARYCWNAPGKPWHGALVHALDQTCGRHWGPDREGQVDSGMTTGTGLLALECWLAASRGEGKDPMH